MRMKSSSSPSFSRQRVQEPPQPWGTKYLDLLRLLSPRTWYGLNRNSQRFPFTKSIEWNALQDGLWGLLLPCVVFMSLKQLLVLSDTSWSPLVPLYLTSPWACHCLYEVTKPFGQLAQAGWIQRQFRTQVLPEAVEILQEMVAQSRVIRKRRFDVYLPRHLAVQQDTHKLQLPNPKSSSKSTTKDSRILDALCQHQNAILFLPGSAVSHVAYARIASLFANAGFIVVIPSMEPIRSAQPHLGAEWSSMRRIMQNVQQRYANNNPCLWTLAGHSIGSFAALYLWAQYWYDQNKNKNENKLGLCLSSKVVLWATMYLPTFGTQVVNDTTLPPIQILLLQADQDPLVESTMAYKDDFLSLLPPLVSNTTVSIKQKSKTLRRQTKSSNYPASQLQIRSIRQGTHQGFACYQPKFSFGDDTTKLTRQEQQQLAVDETLQFLLQDNGP